MKAQTEMIGLVVVVLLLSIIVLFVIAFVAFNPSEDPREEFRREQLATTTIDAMLQTTVCNGRKVSDLIIDCAENTLSPRLSCDGMPSCQLLASDAGPIKTMLDLTLEEWGELYVMRSYVLRNGEEELFRFANDACIGERDTQTFPLATTRETVLVELRVCR